MYPLLYRDGGNQTTDDGGLSVLQGRVLGGSTVVNMADVTEIPDEVLGHWAAQFGVSRYGKEAIREAEAACRAAIGSVQIASHNRANQLLLDGARRLGLRGGTFASNRANCVGAGHCLIGCAQDAKRSAALTWIPRATATGRALIQTDARVTHLEHVGGRATAAVGSTLGPSDQRPRAPFRVEADTFVLAAGAIHSPLILQSSGLGGKQVGRNLSLQPQVPVAAIFRDPIVAFRGIPQSAWIDLEERSIEMGLGGYRIEGVYAGPGMAALSTAMPPSALHQFMARYAQTAASLCLVPDRPTGRVTRQRNGRPKIRYRLTREVRTKLLAAIRTAAEVYLAAGAEFVALPFPSATPVGNVSDLAQLDRYRIRSASTPLISAHPQGTCRMGPDPSRSVVGLDLRVHGVTNLAVLDASIFPTTASSHTMLPVMSLAWLGAHELAKS